MNRSPWIRLALAFAVVKSGMALAEAASEVSRHGLSSFRPLTMVFCLLVITFGMAAALLLHGGRSDSRAFSLAAVFLLIASAFADPLVERLAEAAPAASTWLGLFVHIQVVALMPFFLWCFASEFPRTASFGTSAVLLRAFRSLSLSVGILLLILDGAVYVSEIMPAARVLAFLKSFSRTAPTEYFWIILLTFAAPSLIVMMWKTRAARETESRRVRLFIGSLVSGFTPILVAVLIESLVPGVVWWKNPTAAIIVRVVVYLPLLSVPMTTSYSVMVNRVLDVRLVFRKALQYAMARYFVVSMMTIPLVALSTILYRGRNETLAGLIFSARALALLGILGLGLLTLYYRRTILDLIDRRFFREQYDSRTILTALVDQIRLAASIGELSDLLTNQVERALHPDRVGFLIKDAHRDRLVDPGNRLPPLAAASQSLRRLSVRVGTKFIDLQRGGVELADLPEELWHWLAGTGFAFLLPVQTTTGMLLGVIGLGEKLSELPYSDDDLILLGAIAGAAALALENRQLREARKDFPGLVTTASEAAPAESGQPPRAASYSRPDEWIDVTEAAALECPNCASVFPPTAAECSKCNRATTPATVPFILSGKFKMEERIGRGGMGVVYRATDMDLGREVAVKTLPRMSLDASLQLRKEAHAAAAVVHPNLAVIYGAESWHGTPLLIFEYLPSGTLSSKIQRGPLSITQTLEMGVALADAVICIHRAGILHRDIKPSNIGFTRDGVPKLLDFGLALVFPGLAEQDSGQSCSAIENLTGDGRDTMSLSGRLVGTPLYLSPEALRGVAADPTFDLWALAVVLYESLAGVHPWLGADLRESLRHICDTEVPDPRTFCPYCPASIASLLRDLLAADIRRRPKSARAFKARLQESIAEDLTDIDKPCFS